MEETEKQHLPARLTTLREEHKNGSTMKAALEERLEELNKTLLRIEGAIQVLEELLGTGRADSVSS